MIKINTGVEDPPPPTMLLYLLASEYDAIYQRLQLLREPTAEQGMTAIASVVGQKIVDRMLGEVVGFRVVEKLPDERLERYSPPV